MLKFQLVLFDYDGTLADTDELLLQIFWLLADKYKNGQRISREEIKKYSGPILVESMKKEFPNEDPHALVNEYREISKVVAKQYTKPFPHMKETLKHLYDEGVVIGFISNKNHDGIIDSCQMIEVAQYGKVFIGHDDVINPKPSGDSVIMAMEKLNITDKSKVLYVGDNITDYLTAKDAGVSSCIVNWGGRNFSKDSIPDYRINDFLDLINIVL